MAADDLPRIDAVDEIRFCQAVGNYLLRQLSAHCDERGIRFYLDAGTLLGAYRSEGWIPWDDDVDVLMLRSDYVKFVSSIGALPNDIGFSSPFMADHLTIVPRVRYKQSRTTSHDRFGAIVPERGSLHLDIFVIETMPNGKFRQWAWFGILRIIHLGRYTRMLTLRQIWSGKESFLVRLGATFARILTAPFGPRTFTLWYEQLATAYLHSTSPEFAVPSHSKSMRKIVIEESWLEGHTVNFEGHRYQSLNPAPYLSAMYGEDFLNPPPQNARKGHQHGDLRGVFPSDY